MSTLGPRTALKSRKISGSLAYILAQTNVKQGTKAAANDVAGCTLEMSASGWVGCLGVFASDAAMATAAGGNYANLANGSLYRTYTKTMSYGGVAIGWQSDNLYFKLDSKQSNTTNNTPTISYVFNGGATTIPSPKYLKFSDGSLLAHTTFNGVPIIRNASAGFPDNKQWHNFNILQRNTGDLLQDRFANVTVISFVTDSTLIEYTAANGYANLVVYVDDEPAISFPNSTAESDGGRVRTLLTFPTRSERKINLCFSGSTKWWDDTAFAIESAAMIAPVPCRKVVFFGDSYLGGYTITNGPLDTHLYGIDLAWTLGLLDGYQSNAIGGTGYTTSPNGIISLTQRIQDTLAQGTFDDAFVFLGINDQTYVSSDVISALTMLKGKVKNVFAFLRFNPKPGSIASIPSRDSQFLADAASCGAVAIGINWFNGTGHYGNLIGDGNSDYCIGSDGTHPQALGQQMIVKKSQVALLKSQSGGFSTVNNWSPS